MKLIFALLTLAAFHLFSFHSSAQTTPATSVVKTSTKNLYIDVHRLEPGKVKYEEVAKAHAKDLATQEKYGVDFLKFWVDEEKGLVYCLSSAANPQSITKTHSEAHGLLP